MTKVAAAMSCSGGRPVMTTAAAESNVKTWVAGRLCLRGSVVGGGGSGGGLRMMRMVNGRHVKGGREAIPSYFVMDEADRDALHAFKLGRFVEERFVYRQTFVIRSYEIGPDKTATMETLMNLLQETALNHVMSSGLASDGFGATHQMSLRELIWVVTWVNIQVDKYSYWGDVVEVDTWVAASGKNSMRRDWIIRDYNTKQIITRATSNWVIMHRETRRLSKISEQVREEVQPFYLDRRIKFESGEERSSLDKLSDATAENITSGLAPRWNDMDVNQHVNNIKYIGWILESVPMEVLEDYQLRSMTLEYRRECRQSQLLESLTSMKTAGDGDDDVSGNRDLGSTHLLRLQENKAEVVRARAQWRVKERS